MEIQFCVPNMKVQIQPNILTPLKNIEQKVIWIWSMQMTTVAIISFKGNEIAINITKRFQFIYIAIFT